MVSAVFQFRYLQFYIPKFHFQPVATSPVLHPSFDIYIFSVSVLLKEVKSPTVTMTISRNYFRETIFSLPTGPLFFSTLW